MPPIHRSGIAKGRVLPIVVFSLLIIAVGCGRRRENFASAPPTESKSANAEVAPMDRDGSAEVAESAAAPAPRVVDTAPGSNAPVDDFESHPEREAAAFAAAAEPASAPAPRPAAAKSQRADVARTRGSQPRAARAPASGAPAAFAPTALSPAASSHSIGANSAINSGSAAATEPLAAFDLSESAAASASPVAAEMSADSPPANPAPSNLPAGSTADDYTVGFATVPVYYATDRQNGHVPLSAYEVTGNKRLLASLGGFCLLSIAVSAFCGWRGRTRLAATSSLAACVTGALATAYVIAGGATIEKHGVTYSGDRGSLTRGVCEVTVPKVHEPGIVERPSLLRLEFREDQQKHIVLTSAVELSQDEFHARLSESVAAASEKDVLVFIHGYNVDFQSAVRRTAQIAVDLPFEGVPVCYTWPSQGSLLGYSVDETNAEWTTTHLKQFLLELVEQTDAKSINVIAHSMGNRPMTAAMEQIGWQLESETRPPFDRVVLAAPDVDADRFRRDFGPALSKVANHVTLYASSDDQALIASKQVHGYPRAGESGDHVVVVPGVETIDVSGIDLSLLGHSYYGDSQSMLRDLYEVVRSRLSAPQRPSLITRQQGELVYWQLALRNSESATR